MAIIPYSPVDRLQKTISPGVDENVLAAIMREAAKIVVVTQAQYDALATKDASTIYIVTA